MRDIEADVEQAVVQGIKAQLDADGYNGAVVHSITDGSLGTEIIYPSVHVACQPVAHKGGQVKQWMSSMTITITTKHLTQRDREGLQLISLLGSVGYACDFGDFSQYALKVNSIQVTREGGTYIFGDSNNEVEINCRLEICGSKI